LSVMQPHDLAQYLPVSVLKRVSPDLGFLSVQ
jgi:hypothetical protein